MMNMQRHLDQTDELILYLVRSLTRGVPHLLVEGGGVLTTMLAKLLFLIDVFSMQAYGERATDFRYVRYRFGPYPLAQLEQRLEALGRFGLEVLPGVTIENGRSYRIYRLSSDSRVQLQLSSQLHLLAEEVMTTFASLGLDEVLEQVYSLEVVRNAKFGEEIILDLLRPMEELSNLIPGLVLQELLRPSSEEHEAALEKAQLEESNENIRLADASRDKQRAAFRFKQGG